jgi:hypothetical protein
MRDLKGWQIGDRVMAKERIPTNPFEGIAPGMHGTVININWQLCVKWDNFHGGHNSSQTDVAYTGNSLWWVFEGTVELDGGIVENE